MTMFPCFACKVFYQEAGPWVKTTGGSEETSCPFREINQILFNVAHFLSSLWPSTLHAFPIMSWLRQYMLNPLDEPISKQTSMRFLPAPLPFKPHPPCGSEPFFLSLPSGQPSCTSPLLVQRTGLGSYWLQYRVSVTQESKWQVTLVHWSLSSFWYLAGQSSK